MFLGPHLSILVFLYANSSKFKLIASFILIILLLGLMATISSPYDPTLVYFFIPHLKDNIAGIR